MIGSQAKADDLQDRLIDLAVRIINLANKLPRTPAGRHVAGQILKSGTSPAPNYGEARGAESPADFVHKLRIALKELNETTIWLQIIRKSGMINPELLVDIIEENQQLSRIISSSIKTASKARGVSSAGKMTNDK
jgi:four helix bundle protein